MSTYVPLGPRVASVNQGQVAADLTGRNIGNWTVQYTPQDINCTIPYFEVCHIVVNGAPGSSFSIFIDTFQWDTNQNGFSNSWDPSVPMPLRPGQYLYFFWSDVATDGTPPTVTIWLRYDQDIVVNKAAVLGLSPQLWVGHHSSLPRLLSRVIVRRRVSSFTMECPD